MVIGSTEASTEREPLLIHELAAFIADRAHGFDPTWSLPRGRRLTLPILESIIDVPLDLADVVGNRPAILVFYQGGWSRPCNDALAMFQRSMPHLEPQRVAVVAITPELPRHARETSRRNQLTFALAIDHACRFAKSLGLAFKLPLQLRRLVRDCGVRLKQWNGEGSYDLPMPTMILIDRECRVRWTASGFATTDLEPEAVIAALGKLDGVDADSM
jgi:peroxiredoxin